MHVATETRSMKIMAPVHNLHGTKLQIQAGADQIYVGLRSPEETGMKMITFTGRYYKSGKNEPAQVDNINELKAICDLCHEHGVVVNYTANVRYLHQSLTGLYLDHVRRGIEAGVDSLIVGNLGAVQLLKKEGIRMPLHASTFLFGYNLGHIHYLESLGFERIVLATQLNMDEIREVCANTKAEIEVFAQFACSNINGRCNLLHTPYVADLYDGYDMQCRGQYTVWTDSFRRERETIFYAGLDCTICQLPDLMDAGVGVLKILGRDRIPEFIAPVTKVYRQCLDMYGEGKTVEEVRSFMYKKVPWWKGAFCAKSACLYGDNRISRSYIQ